jgi:hypothetical protein
MKINCTENSSGKQIPNILLRVITTVILISLIFIGTIIFKSYNSQLTKNGLQAAAIQNRNLNLQSHLTTVIKSKNIEDIQVGERVRGKNPLLSDTDRNDFGEPIPETWRKITFLIIDSVGDQSDIVLLRDLDWINNNGIVENGVASLSLTELGISGQAKVISIEPCPDIFPGRGNVVTGTFRHIKNNIIDLYIKGSDTPISCTSNHPFWSDDRQTFIEATTLIEGENVCLFSGDTARIIQKLPRPGPQLVYNIEVHGEHVYEVSTKGILVHNTSMVTSRFGEGYVAKAGDVMTYKEWQNLKPEQRNGLHAHHPIPGLIIEDIPRGILECKQVELTKKNAPVIILSPLEHYATNSYGGKAYSQEWTAIHNRTHESILVDSFEYGLDDPVIQKYPDAWKQLVEDYLQFLYIRK